MKRYGCLMLVALLFASLIGCGSKVYKKDVSDYFDDAKVENSAFAFYVYDGSTTTVRYLYDADQEKEILKSLKKAKALPVADWTPSKGAVPFYGISIGGSEGDLTALYAGGFVVLGDGRVYDTDYNFSGLEGKYAWRDMAYFGGLAIPGAYYAALGQNGWKKEFLSVSDLDVNDRIEMKVTDKNGDAYTFEITNKMGMDWVYGEYFSVEVFLDDEWYMIPAKTDYAVNDIAFILPMDGTGTKTYDIKPYGELPNGKYRIVIKGRDVCSAYVFNK